MNDDIIDVDVLFDQELKMDLREADVKTRVVNYFMLCDDIILRNGLSNIFSTPNGIKAKCKFLKQYLEPVALRDAVDTHHRLVDSSSKADERVLYQLVKNKALEQEKVFRLLSKRKQHPGEGASKPRREASRVNVLVPIRTRISGWFATMLASIETSRQPQRRDRNRLLTPKASRERAASTVGRITG
ncbi:hypothetical protein PHMEG_00029246 [Phytophthora megakarya]|uniref:Uncharacterized protein n=1 Tax=Phytophthora megakarya TaxID=4795 RepID=A0A225V363_9STRA|nr:hypothetical protein PHMEG_00029246 [Phytophthora megakarya]